MTRFSMQLYPILRNLWPMLFPVNVFIAPKGDHGNCIRITAAGVVRMVAVQHLHIVQIIFYC